MIKIRGVHHLAISVPSLQAAKAFYVDTLGFALADESELPPSKIADTVTQLTDAHSHVLMVNAGNVFLEIFEYHSPAPALQKRPRVCDHGYTHFALEVDDIDEAYQALAEAGVEWHCAPVEVDEGYRMTYGRDPFGNIIEIQQLQTDVPYSFSALNDTCNKEQ
jgi:glyoxylase I family protein